MLVTVVGAGASADCVSDDNRHNDQYRPPLVAGLFNSKSSNVISDTLDYYPGDNRVAADIEVKLSRGTSSFTLEKYLRETLKSSKIDSEQLAYLEIPLYLQHLL